MCSLLFPSLVLYKLLAEVHLSLRDRKEFILVLECVLCSYIVVRTHFMPFHIIPVCLLYSLVVDSPSHEVLSSVSFECKLIRSFIDDGLTELFI